MSEHDIAPGVYMSHYGEERELNLNEEESEFVSRILRSLASHGVNTKILKTVRKSDSYATIVMHGTEYDFDLIRFKLTSRTKWLSTQVDKQCIDEHSSDSLFAIQKNKRQLMWRADISDRNNEDILVPIIVRSYINELSNNHNNYCI